MLLSPRRPRQGRMIRRKRRALLESLENRQLLAGDVPQVVDEMPANIAPVVDLNGTDEIDTDFHVCFDGAAALIADSDATLTDIDGGPIAGAGNGDIITVSRFDNEVLRIDPSTGTITDTYVIPDSITINPRGIAIDNASGDIFVVGNEGTIVKVTADGTVSTVPDPEGALTGSKLHGVEVEADGQLLVSDQTLNSESLHRVNPVTGTVTTLLQTTAENDVLQQPYGIELDANGTLLIADQTSIKRYDLATGDLEEVETDLVNPVFEDVAVDANGNVLALDLSLAVRGIVRIGPGSQTTVIATGITGTPKAIAIDSNGDIVTSRFFVTRMSPEVSTGNITTYASNGSGPVNGDGTVAKQPWGVDVESIASTGDNIASLTVTISNPIDGSDEALTAVTAGTNISASYATGTLTLTGDDTAANYQTVLGTISYSNVAATPDPTDRVIIVIANDGSDDSDPAITTIEFNQAPVIEPQTLQAIENATDAGIVVASDPGHCEDTLTYSISGGDDGSQFSIDPVTGELTFDSAPDYEIPTDAGEDNVYEVEVTVTDSKDVAVAALVTVNVANQANVSGFVFADVDGDGEFDAEDAPLTGIEITLTQAGVDSIFTTTDDDGFYGFEDVAAGEVQVIESGAPTDLEDGIDSPGDTTDLDNLNDQFTVSVGTTDLSELNFAEQAKTGELGRGDVASIGYWHNRRGQRLIDDLDEEGALTDWLLTHFDNIFDQADFDEYGGDVGRFYRREFFRKKFRRGPKVDAQFMAVAFATFATSSNLSGTIAVGTRFNVTETGIGTTVVNVGDSGAAFGVDDDSDVTIMALLLATNNLTGSGADLVYDGAQDVDGDGLVDNADGDIGSLDSYERMLRTLSNDVYSDITRSRRFCSFWFFC